MGTGFLGYRHRTATLVRRHVGDERCYGCWFFGREFYFFFRSFFSLGFFECWRWRIIGRWWCRWRWRWRGWWCELKME